MITTAVTLTPGSPTGQKVAVGPESRRTFIALAPMQNSSFIQTTGELYLDLPASASAGFLTGDTGPKST